MKEIKDDEKAVFEEFKKIEELVKEVKDPFTRKLFFMLKEKLEKKNKKISFIEVIELNRIKNLIEKERRRKDLSKQKIPEKTLVYVFKVYLTHGIWRIVEIKGDELLSELDYLIQKTFDHEPGHLYEFRFREYRFGPKCDEWQEIFDCLSNKRIDVSINLAGLKVGDKSKYIYDFGQNIEHKIELVEIKEPGENQKYPRMIGNEKTVRCEECNSANALLWCHTCHAKLCEECSEKCSEKNLGYCQEGHYPLLSIYPAKKSQWS